MMHLVSPYLTRPHRTAPSARALARRQPTHPDLQVSRRSRSMHVYAKIIYGLDAPRPLGHCQWSLSKHLITMGFRDQDTTALVRPEALALRAQSGLARRVWIWLLGAGHKAAQGGGAPTAVLHIPLQSLRLSRGSPPRASIDMF